MFVGVASLPPPPPHSTGSVNIYAKTTVHCSPDSSMNRCTFGRGVFLVLLFLRVIGPIVTLCTLSIVTAILQKQTNPKNRKYNAEQSSTPLYTAIVLKSKFGTT
jgi:hypothetical protein